MGDDIFRAAIDRSLASSKRAGWLNGGRTRRKASGGGIARHDVMGAGVSTHLVCCSTKCAGARVGRAKKRSSFRVEYQYSPSDE